MNTARSKGKLISVISANYNGATYLQSCISSVAEQSDVNVEHIIIDGGSSDGSQEILKKSSDLLSYWCSEPDEGIADAMNKGIPRAKGEWLLFLHADDQLLDKNSLSKAMTLLATTDAKIVGFPISYGSLGTGKIILPRGANRWQLLKSGFLHQGTFIHKSVFKKIGLYDTRCSIAMDYEFFLRAWTMGIPAVTHAAPVVSWMRDTGVSARRDWSTLSRRFNEEKYIHIKYSNNAAQKFFYGIYWWFYLCYRKLLNFHRTGSER